MPLQILRRDPAPRLRHRLPLLFVHGGYTHAACWEEHFLDHFAALGHPVAALSLRGHGDSDGTLDHASLDDYAADLTEAAAPWAGRLAIIGHSMGAVVAQRHLARQPATAAILLAPVPPGGVGMAALATLFSRPAFFPEMLLASRGVYSNHTLKTLRDVFFSDEVPAARLMRYAGYFQPESARVLLELALPGVYRPGGLNGTPGLVLGGEADALFAPFMVRATARHLGVEAQLLPGVGHAMMLDAQWDSVAAAMAVWLDGLAG